MLNIPCQISTYYPWRKLKAEPINIIREIDNKYRRDGSIYAGHFVGWPPIKASSCPCIFESHHCKMRLAQAPHYLVSSWSEIDPKPNPGSILETMVQDNIIRSEKACSNYNWSTHSETLSESNSEDLQDKLQPRCLQSWLRFIAPSGSSQSWSKWLKIGQHSTAEVNQHAPFEWQMYFILSITAPKL